MASPASAERSALVAALQAVAPTAPTLCDGWTALDLAAHVVARERRPDSLPGLVVPALAGWTDRVRSGYARRPYPELIDLVAGGPPRTSLFALPGVEAAANLVEFAVHTEDVRRGAPGWQPRALDEAQVEAVWAALGRTARLAFRRSPVPVALVRPDGRRIEVRRGEGDPVTLTGDPLELLLYASGRREAARVTLEGPDDAVARLRDLHLGL